MPEYRTTKCSAHGHRELTVVLDESPIPGLHQLLTSYVEDAVARGTKFLPGQTLQLGWSTLRFFERRDGTLGIQERDPAPEEKWVESAYHALTDLFFQREIVTSLGLQEQLAFPRQLEGVMISACVDGADSFLLSRLPKSPDLPPDFSGWTLRCAQDHDHGERSVIPLLAIAAMQPGLVQLLALPHGCTALVMWKATPDAPEGFKRIVPHVFRGSEELKPAPGSYLAGLQQR